MTIICLKSENGVSCPAPGGVPGTEGRSYCCNSNDRREYRVLQQLAEYGIPRDHITDVGEMILGLENRQYFDLPNLPYLEEVFVDAGCFESRMVKNLIKWSKGAYKRVYAFEPYEKGFEMSEKELEDMDGLYLDKRWL